MKIGTLGKGLEACSSRKCLRLNLAWVWGHAPQGNVKIKSGAIPRSVCVC